MTPRKPPGGTSHPAAKRGPALSRHAAVVPGASLTVQLASPASDVPAGPGWVHEIKYDGYRVLAHLDGSAARLVTRSGKDWSERFPTVVDALSGLGLRNTVLDGEVAVELEDGTTSFQYLQNAGGSPSAGRLRFYVFDLLYLDGGDLRARPLLERKSRLEGLVPPGHPVLRYSDHVRGSGPAFFAQACRLGLEGIISKVADGAYRGGRSRSWLKLKCVREQEFVVGGYTEPAGSRGGLGALHVGTYDDAGRLEYRGKVGTGFTASVLRDLRRRLDGLARADSPFAGGPTGASARGSRWVDPEVVVQVRYTELTRDGRLRHPAYRGLRVDKSAAGVRLEVPAVAGTGTAPVTGGSRRPEGAEPLAPEEHSVEQDGGGMAEKKTRAGAAAPVLVAGTRLTSPSRVLYPGQGLTKLDLARYYEGMAEWMLPHLARRPLTLVRCPAGRQAECFYQKHMDASAPASIERVSLEERSGPKVYGAVRDLSGLVALVQMGALELHTWNSRSDRLERPDRFVIDLDPDPAVAWDAVVDAALHVRYVLDDLGLESFLKTTGGKGLHVVVPLVRRSGWDEVKAFSRAVATTLAGAAPDLYTTDLALRKRSGRILLDYLRNSRGATAVEAYSTRSREGAPVAAPIHWDELADGVRADTFNVRNMPGRVADLGQDPWSGMGSVRQSLTAEMKRRAGL
jgi:bifunctional non-homologous end joining protein LigD